MRLLLVFLLLCQSAVAQEANCNGGRFAPCVCVNDVPKQIRYAPKFRACGGKAAAILQGKYKGIFSVALRDSENSDREPPNFGNCSQAERDAGEAKCSAYKVQRRFRTEFLRKKAVVHCFGLPGKHTAMKKARRLTIKLKNLPNSTNDPLLRVCLKRGDKSLNIPRKRRLSDA